MTRLVVVSNRVADPEADASGGLAVCLIHKQAVVAALDFVQGVAQNRKEILVGGLDDARQIKFDDRLGFVDGGDLAAQLH